MPSKLEFRVSSGLKNIIGKDLITDEFVAVFELVKNSYDAHAKNVILTVEDDKIIVADDGKGMSYNDLVNKWLFVAYSAKKDGSEDEEDGNVNESYRDKIQERRHYAGSKGIGRFSSDRLGALLTITSRKIGIPKIEQIKIDWRKFDKSQNETFQKVKVDHDTIGKPSIPFPKNSAHGTTLEITRLHTKWNRNRLKELKHSLEKLINPFSDSNDFNIEIICQREMKEDLEKVDGKPKYIERDKINGKVKNSILEILNLKTTRISVELNSEHITTKVIDRDTEIYHIKEENKKFKLLSNVRIDLYFLNQAAKHNFSRRMGVQPVQFGSVFLFKNGFRVQPFGEPGDDSWGLDYRAQQGYNRFLGTRDLLGRFEILTNNTKEFKEVSSRDGGLVETTGYHQIMSAFKEKALLRLERYVVGVLWGEGFKKRGYFGKGNEANQIAEGYRKLLQQKDKVSDNVTAIKSNLGSKIDFIQIIKSLSTDKSVEIVNYNKDFVDLINDRLDEVQTKFISDLDRIATETNDPELRVKLTEAERKYQELVLAKEEAERLAQEEEERRIAAEHKAKEEEKARREAERKRREEAERRRKAELEALKKEKERAEAELAKLKAQREAEEAEKRRKKAEDARRKAEEERKISENQVRFLQSVKAIEYEDVRDLNHIIGINADTIKKKLLLFKRKIDRGTEVENEELLKFIQGISMANDKIATISNFTTKGNFLKASSDTTEDIVAFVRNYLENIYLYLYDDIKIEFINSDLNFERHFKPIELSVVIDNLISNSRKKSARRIEVEFGENGKRLQITFRDFGKSLDPSIRDWKKLFEEGVTTTNGSGLGLAHVKKIVSDMKGAVHINPKFKEGFEITITLPK